jgi:tripartite-type tricarboxylate transporter receptor subunit TctC
VLHVPYGGGGPAVQAVLGEVTSLTLLSYAALRSQIAAGKLKALAVTGARRLPELPEVPTVAESGFPASRPIRGSASSRRPARQRPRCIN